MQRRPRLRNVVPDCVGRTPLKCARARLCQSPNECTEQSSCDTETGECVDTPFHNGTECGGDSNGVCSDGVCDPRADAGSDNGCACRAGSAGGSGPDRHLAWALLLVLTVGRVVRRRRERLARCERTAKS
jgi:MYXO-CTERM domain-containing protein